MWKYDEIFFLKTTTRTLERKTGTGKERRISLLNLSLSDYLHLLTMLLRLLTDPFFVFLLVLMLKTNKFYIKEKHPFLHEKT